MPWSESDDRPGEQRRAGDNTPKGGQRRTGRGGRNKQRWVTDQAQEVAKKLPPGRRREPQPPPRREPLDWPRRQPPRQRSRDQHYPWHDDPDRGYPDHPRDDHRRDYEQIDFRFTAAPRPSPSHR